MGRQFASGQPPEGVHSLETQHYERTPYRAGGAFAGTMSAAYFLEGVAIADCSLEGLRQMPKLMAQPGKLRTTVNSVDQRKIAIPSLHYRPRSPHRLVGVRTERLARIRFRYRVAPPNYTLHALVDQVAAGLIKIHTMDEAHIGLDVLSSQFNRRMRSIEYASISVCEPFAMNQSATPKHLQ
ncbi:MAG: hypothetical protein JJ911_07845 [Rhizobiaceae bacterium]|nr:hypothetical protein [Rhizobiaceae bacterium]